MVGANCFVCGLAAYKSGDRKKKPKGQEVVPSAPFLSNQKNILALPVLVINCFSAHNILQSVKCEVSACQSKETLGKHTEAYILRVQNSDLRVAHVKINVYCGSSIIRHLATRNQIKSHFKSSQLSFYNAQIILVGDKSTIEQKAGSTKEEKNCKFTASENGR